MEAHTALAPSPERVAVALSKIGDCTTGVSRGAMLLAFDAASSDEDLHTQLLTVLPDYGWTFSPSPPWALVPGGWWRRPLPDLQIRGEVFELSAANPTRWDVPC